jgi:hypothetical protein
MNELKPWDLLEDVRRLSPGLLLLAFLVGCMLWGFGGRLYRFWVILLATLLGGAAGLEMGPNLGLQRLVAAALFGATAGALALSLFDVVVFLLGGASATLVVLQIGTGQTDPLPFFLAGGLAFLLLRSLFLVVFTAAVGTALMGAGVLGLMESKLETGAAGWPEFHADLLAGIAAVICLVGCVAQWFTRNWFKTNETPPRLAPPEAGRNSRPSYFGTGGLVADSRPR